MGYFDDVQIQAEETPKGEVDLHIVLKERPSIKSIEVEGNKVFNKEEILDQLTTKSLAVTSLRRSARTSTSSRRCTKKRATISPRSITR